MKLNGRSIRIQIWNNDINDPHWQSADNKEQTNLFREKMIDKRKIDAFSFLEIFIWRSISMH